MSFVSKVYVLNKWWREDDFDFKIMGFIFKDDCYKTLQCLKCKSPNILTTDGGKVSFYHFFWTFNLYFFSKKKGHINNMFIKSFLNLISLELKTWILHFKADRAVSAWTMRTWHITTLFKILVHLGISISRFILHL